MFLDSFLVLASAPTIGRAAGRALSEIRSDDDNGFLRRTGTTGRPSASGMYDFFFSFVVVAPSSVARGETPWLCTGRATAPPTHSPPRACTDWACAAALTDRRIVRLRALCSGCRAQLTAAAELMTLSQCGLRWRFPQHRQTERESPQSPGVTNLGIDEAPSAAVPGPQKPYGIRILARPSQRATPHVPGDLPPTPGAGGPHGPGSTL